MRRDGLLSMVAMLVLSGSHDGSRGKHRRADPNGRRHALIGRCSARTRRIGGRHPDRRRRHDPRGVPRTGPGRAVDRHRHARDGRPIPARAVFRRAGVALHRPATHRPGRSVGVRRGAARSVRAHARVRVAGRTTVQPAAGSPRLCGRRHVPAERSLRGCASRPRRRRRSARTVGFGAHVPSQSRIGAILRIPACASRHRLRTWTARTSAYRHFHVLPPDPQNFDGDHNGIGCET